MIPANYTETEQRLLRAAGEVFAERGFEAATTREICERAGANVAAINYHFGDKAKLYLATLQHVYSTLIEKYPPTYGISADAPAEERLYAFIYSFLLRILDEENSPCLGKILAREMLEPSLALDRLISENIQPVFQILLDIVQEVLGDCADKDLVHLCTASIIGQCTLYHHRRAVCMRLSPLGAKGRPLIEKVAQHIFDFSLSALRGQLHKK